MYKAFIKVIAIVAGSLFFAGHVQSQSPDVSAIRRILNEQIKAWNKGDKPAYMKGYWNSDSLIFIGKNGIRQGYAETLMSYKKGYPDTAAMGKLGLELLQLKRLSAQYYFAIGKWDIKRTAGDLAGYFTLLFKKIKSKWLIIADHSS